MALAYQNQNNIRSEEVEMRMLQVGYKLSSVLDLFFELWTLHLIYCEPK